MAFSAAYSKTFFDQAALLESSAFAAAYASRKGGVAAVPQVSSSLAARPTRRDAAWDDIPWDDAGSTAGSAAAAAAPSHGPRHPMPVSPSMTLSSAPSAHSSAARASAEEASAALSARSRSGPAPLLDAFETLEAMARPAPAPRRRAPSPPRAASPSLGRAALHAAVACAPSPPRARGKGAASAVDVAGLLSRASGSAEGRAALVSTAPALQAALARLQASNASSFHAAQQRQVESIGTVPATHAAVLDLLESALAQGPWERGTVAAQSSRRGGAGSPVGAGLGRSSPPKILPVSVPVKGSSSGEGRRQGKGGGPSPSSSPTAKALPPAEATALKPPVPQQQRPTRPQSTAHIDAAPLLPVVPPRPPLPLQVPRVTGFTSAAAVVAAAAAASAAAPPLHSVSRIPRPRVVSRRSSTDAHEGGSALPPSLVTPSSPTSSSKSVEGFVPPIRCAALPEQIARVDASKTVPVAEVLPAPVPVHVAAAAEEEEVQRPQATTRMPFDPHNADRDALQAALVVARRDRARAVRALNVAEALLADELGLGAPGQLATAQAALTSPPAAGKLRASVNEGHMSPQDSKAGLLARLVRRREEAAAADAAAAGARAAAVEAEGAAAAEDAAFEDAAFEDASRKAEVEALAAAAEEEEEEAEEEEEGLPSPPPTPAPDLPVDVRVRAVERRYRAWREASVAEGRQQAAALDTLRRDNAAFQPTRPPPPTVEPVRERGGAEARPPPPAPAPPQTERPPVLVHAWGGGGGLISSLSLVSSSGPGSPLALPTSTPAAIAAPPIRPIVYRPAPSSATGGAARFVLSYSARPSGEPYPEPFSPAKPTGFRHSGPRQSAAPAPAVAHAMPLSSLRDSLAAADAALDSAGRGNAASKRHAASLEYHRGAPVPVPRPVLLHTPMQSEGGAHQSDSPSPDEEEGGATDAVVVEAPAPAPAHRPVYVPPQPAAALVAVAMADKPLRHSRAGAAAPPAAPAPAPLAASPPKAVAAPTPVAVPHVSGRDSHTPARGMRDGLEAILGRHRPGRRE
jgi:hypothetical protein